MVKKILLSGAAAVAIFIIYVASRPGTFRYERSGVINAPPEKIYPYLSDLRLGSEWSPYEKTDLNMKKTFSGPTKGPGSVMEFEGNSDIGSGRLEILKEVPNSTVEIRLDMLKPMKASNLIQYTLTPEGKGTRFAWVMSGEGGFISKLFGVIIDCDKMVGDQFSQGIENLKTVVESKI